jgi:hypothetical protein
MVSTCPMLVLFKHARKRCVLRSAASAPHCLQGSRTDARDSGLPPHGTSLSSLCQLLDMLSF